MWLLSVLEEVKFYFKGAVQSREAEAQDDSHKKNVPVAGHLLNFPALKLWPVALLLSLAPERVAPIVSSPSQVTPSR